MAGVFNSLISRTDADALIPEEISREIIQMLPQQSFVLRHFRTVRMSQAQTRLPVLSALASAYFVAEGGLKQTTEVNWGKAALVPAEIAAIVPVPQAVIDDVSFDLWGEIKGPLTEAIGRALDNMVLFGEAAEVPTGWSTGIVPAAIAAGNTVTAASDLLNELGGPEGVMAAVENGGFEVNIFLASPTMKSALRVLRSTDGVPIFAPSLQANVPSTLWGQPIEYVTNGAWEDTAALLIAGDRRQAVIGIRQDIQFKILDQAVIQDDTGTIVYNLAQQDMLAMRVTARFAFQVPNPVTAMGGGYPFAVLVPGGS